MKDKIQKGLHIQAILSNTHLIYPTIKEETDCGPIGQTPVSDLRITKFDDKYCAQRFQFASCIFSLSV